MVSKTQECRISILRRSVSLHCSDGQGLGATLFLDPGRVHSNYAVLIVCGVGIPARFYDAMARASAADGHPTLTFDFRGIGASTPRGSLRASKASMNDWGSKDCAAAMCFLRGEFPATPIVVIAHSFGGFLVGLSDLVSRIPSALVLVGPHTGYPGDYIPSKRRAMRFMWHVLMPSLVRVAGYFPGRLLGLPSDLPRTAALEWAGRRDPDIWRDLAATSGRFSREPVQVLRERMARVVVPILAVRAADDAFSTEAGLDRLRTCYVAARFESRRIDPHSYQLNRIGHFRYFSSKMWRFWSELDEWIVGTIAGGDVSTILVGSGPE